MARTLVAGVDTSTQSCKVRVTDAETGELVRFGQAKHPNGTSVDPSYWWSAFQEAAEQAGGLDDVSAPGSSPSFSNPKVCTVWPSSASSTAW